MHQDWLARVLQEIISLPRAGDGFIGYCVRLLDLHDGLKSMCFGCSSHLHYVRIGASPWGVIQVLAHVMIPLVD
jgi:hypothetical protein